MGELIHGPVRQWEPSEDDRKTIARLLASKDDLDRAYGEAYTNRCFVGEVGEDAQGIAAVGELDALDVLEFRLGKELDLKEIGLGALISLGAFPGRGKTRAERVRDGVRKVLEARDKIA